MNYPRIVLAALAAMLVFFAWGFLTEGWLIRKDFAPSAVLCGATSTAMKGLQFGLLMGVFAACIHALSNLVTMNMDLKLGLEITVSTFVGWVLAGIVIGLVYRPAIAAS
jgi:hypothetical protein